MEMWAKPKKNKLMKIIKKKLVYSQNRSTLIDWNGSKCCVVLLSNLPLVTSSQDKLCLPHHILEEKGLVKVSVTVNALVEVPSCRIGPLTWAVARRLVWDVTLRQLAAFFFLHTSRCFRPVVVLFYFERVADKWAGMASRHFTLVKTGKLN